MERASSSSKVTVEYHDPHGVYQLLSPGLLPRLPLRNLHWESHSGPLRSISSLHIDLVSSIAQISPLSTTEVARPEFPRVKSEDSSTGSDGFRTQHLGPITAETPGGNSGPPKTKGRRHQIPGLRQTPYLKVFLLRCDDNETYKASARREVREWIKEHTPPSQSTTRINAQENHDAFEWLIVHVIVPNTAVATQPRSSHKADNSSGTALDKTGANRWRATGSPTILDKLRADFNSSSRSAVDHIAQIRIGVNDVPYEMLPRVVPAIPGSYTETAQENESAWLDLIAKFKELILASFDMRVSQYEEDIRERDAQRNLPGWNFCTFFVLKEGLARGFESVGLVEDALVGYDELAVGLEAVIREQSMPGAGQDHGSTFLPYTDDLKDLLKRSKEALLKASKVGTDDEDPIDLQSDASTVGSDFDEIPLDATKKRYRDLILANNISIYDFRCYLFARQLSLLLRLANASSSQEELLAKLREQRELSLQGVATRFPTSQPSEDAENLSVLGEICKRSMDFVASMSNTLREDLWASQDTSLRGDLTLKQIIDNAVSSFTFSVAQQILAQTSTKALPIPPSTLAPPSNKMGADGQEPKAAIPEPKTMMHPARSSSLVVRSPSPGVFPGRRRSSVPEHNQASPSTPFLKAGLEELAAQRAGLYLLSRNILEQVGKDRSWSVGWAEVMELQYGSVDEMDEVDLDNSKHLEEKDTLIADANLAPTAEGISSKLLHVALDNQDDYYRLYETLTDKALRHYKVASHVQSAQASMADLAVLKFHLEDYAAAASYFYQITPSYNEGGWRQIELSMLVMYAKSLRHLQRKEEYVRVVLKLLSKAALAEKERMAAKASFRLSYSRFAHQEVMPKESYLEELLEITKTLPHSVQVPLQSFFAYVEVDGTPRYHPDRDSFKLHIKLQYLLSESLEVDRVRIKLTAVSGDTSRELWLESEAPIVFKQGIVDLVVGCNMVVPGTYLVNHIGLHTSNVILKFEQGNPSPTSAKDDHFLKCPKLLLYQQANAFDVKLHASKYIHLNRNRSLEIELSSGWNDVLSGELQIRAATSGLRLQTSEAKVVAGSLEIFKTSEVGTLRLGPMTSATNAKIRVPFNLEHEVDEISLKLEVSYTTEKGGFFFATAPRTSIVLPLGVNVQDVFKHKALFSRFTISSATTSPLRLLSSKLVNSDVYQAESGVGLERPVMIFPRQAASMLYKITKASSPSIRHETAKVTSALSLILHYICLEEEIDNAITKALQEDFKDTPLYSYTRLVIRAVLSEIHKQMTPQDLEQTAVLNEISTMPLSSIRWTDHFHGLGRAAEGDEDIPTQLSNKISTWQQEHSGLPLPPISLDEIDISDSRSIVIPVDVPSITVLHTADMKFLDEASSTSVVPVNQPIPAILNIKWTTIWNTDSQVKSTNVASDQSIEFIYEITAPSDSWLVGGRRKGHFKVPSSGSLSSKRKISFPVILIPLREGFLSYPTLDIKPAPVLKVIRPGASMDGAFEDGEDAVTCETDYRNAGETVRVVSDARKTTVSLDASGPQGGAWLLESERRHNGKSIS